MTSDSPNATDDEFDRINELLTCSFDEYEEREEELKAVLGTLHARGVPVVVETICEIEGQGGYSIWGKLFKSIRIGQRKLIAWEQAFTAEAPPPQRNGLAYYERDPDGPHVDLRRLYGVRGVAFPSDAPARLDDV